MRANLHNQNKHLLSAYKEFENNNYQKSLQEYEMILAQSTEGGLRKNLGCTVANIAMAMGDYNYALEVMEGFLHVKSED